ncbi:MAG: hypothetical protein JW860_13825 [Sedimentisphaerales bacterium]|nr:hypothetical protein [Sedimentisphaerales bacterium]
MSGLITRPIILLKQKILDLARGNLNFQIIQTTSQDEIFLMPCVNPSGNSPRPPWQTMTVRSL